MLNTCSHPFSKQHQLCWLLVFYFSNSGTVSLVYLLIIWHSSLAWLLHMWEFPWCTSTSAAMPYHSATAQIDFPLHHLFICVYCRSHPHNLLSPSKHQYWGRVLATFLIQWYLESARWLSLLKRCETDGKLIQSAFSFSSSRRVIWDSIEQFSSSDGFPKYDGTHQ